MLSRDGLCAKAAAEPSARPPSDRSTTIAFSRKTLGIFLDVGFSHRFLTPFQIKRRIARRVHLLRRSRRPLNYS